MAVKTFTAGSVLTASDTNTYLANSGLVYVTSGTLSGTSKDVTSCFSSTYSNYVITLDQLQLSGSADIYFRLLSGSSAASGADYFWAFLGWTDGGAASNSNGSGQTLAFTGFTQASANNIAIGAVRMDIYGPQIAQRTFAKCSAAAYPAGTSATREGSNRHNLSTAYDGIQFLTNSAVTMGGNYAVYGYRKG